MYLTDLIILGLFFISLPTLWRELKALKISRQVRSIFAIVFVCLGLSIFLAGDILLSLSALAKLLECLFFGWYVAKSFVLLKNIRVTSLVFAGQTLLFGGLGIAQFFHHGSLDGLWYFLGERHFTSYTPGIANATINHMLVLRPYSTFPHPNVFGGYLTVMLLFQTYLLQKDRYVLQRPPDRVFFAMRMFAVCIGILALLLSLSRIALVVFVICQAILLFFSLPKKRRFIVFLSLGSIVFLLSIGALRSRFFSVTAYDESLSLRVILAGSALQMILHHPLFGVGPMHYLRVVPTLLRIKTQAYLQPVHTIYLLLLAEYGVPLFLLFSLFIGKTYQYLTHLPNKYAGERTICLLLLSACLCLGLGDHYLVTLQQGLLLFSFVLGLCWTKPSDSVHGQRKKREISLSQQATR